MVNQTGETITQTVETITQAVEIRQDKQLSSRCVRLINHEIPILIIVHGDWVRKSTVYIYCYTHIPKIRLREKM